MKKFKLIAKEFPEVFEYELFFNNVEEIKRLREETPKFLSIKNLFIDNVDTQNFSEEQKLFVNKIIESYEQYLENKIHNLELDNMQLLLVCIDKYNEDCLTNRMLDVLNIPIIQKDEYLNNIKETLQKERPQQ